MGIKPHHNVPSLDWAPFLADGGRSAETFATLLCSSLEPTIMVCILAPIGTLVASRGMMQRAKLQEVSHVK
ncbi:hypothetical protein L7F22_030324, partial [Adiantum nelumboides]|nr:hypothetical protein [Adiantum nelumboides]